MSCVTILSLVTVLASPPAFTADDQGHRKAAEELLKLMDVDKQMNAAVDQMLDLQVRSNPQLGQFRDVMKKFFAKHISWESCREDMITIYKDAFTEAELKEIAAFYRTPAGKKMIAKMPELTRKGMELGAKRVQDNQAELIRMLEEARDRNP